MRSEYGVVGIERNFANVEFQSEGDAHFFGFGEMQERLRDGVGKTVERRFRSGMESAVVARRFVRIGQLGELVDDELPREEDRRRIVAVVAIRFKRDASCGADLKALALRATDGESTSAQDVH